MDAFKNSLVLDGSVIPLDGFNLVITFKFSVILDTQLNDAKLCLALNVKLSNGWGFTRELETEN